MRVTRVRSRRGMLASVAGLASLAFVAFALVGCGKSQRDVTARGAGASLSAPLVARWSEAYTGPGRVDYRAVGSGGALMLLSVGAVDFGVRDVALSAEEITRTAGAYAEIPLAHGTVVVAVNLPGVSELRLGRASLAALFMGEIRTWSDPAIARENPTISLPNLPVLPVHRTDASGTAKRFTAYVAKGSPTFAEQVGTGESPNFPTGVRAKGQDGVALAVKSTRGSIGVLELGLARASGLAVAWLEDDSGTFVAPTPADARGASPYPLVSTVYALVPKAKGAHDDTVRGFLRWALDEGQHAPLGGTDALMSAFGPLSAEERSAAVEALQRTLGVAP